MATIAKLRERLLKTPEVKKEYDRLGPVYALVGAAPERRHEAGLTQQTRPTPRRPRAPEDRRERK